VRLPIIIACLIVAIPFIAIGLTFKIIPWWRSIQRMRGRERRAMLYRWAALSSAALTAGIILLIPAAAVLDYPKTDHYCQVTIRWDDRYASGYEFGMLRGRPGHIVVSSVFSLQGEGIKFSPVPLSAPLSRERFSTLWLLTPMIYLSFTLALGAWANRHVVTRKAFPLGDAACIGYPIHPRAITEKARRHLPTARIYI
jgi:hypothetical protein